MKEIIINENNLSIEDIDEKVTRVKALIINSKNEIMIGYAHKTYQFPGGHVELNESLENGLIRELKEELGITLTNYKIKPFAVLKYYSKNYRNEHKNRENDIYYYLINTDESYHLSQTNYDDWEKEGNYQIKMVNYNDLRNTLIKSIEDNDINKIIVKEMLNILDIYENDLLNV